MNNTNNSYHHDVVIIGSGPAGTIAACFLRQAGFSVLMLDKETHPRFVIGESLLPQCLTVLEKAGCLEAVEQYGFQHKKGAAFKFNDQIEHIVFDQKSSLGPTYAYHVPRAEFDQLLANCAIKQGALLRTHCRVTSAVAKLNDSEVTYYDQNAEKEETVRCRFILDASGYGRVLATLFEMEKRSTLVPRASLFTHVVDHIEEGIHHRNETLITIHPQHKDIWFWLISFSNGVSSVGVVGNAEYIASYQERGIEGLQEIIKEDPVLADILKDAEYHQPHHAINGYSASVDTLHGDGFAILGNAGEFLDPVFSSGVTMAIQSSDYATQALIKTLNGEACDWDMEYTKPLMFGVDTFQTYVESWYNEDLQKIIFAQNKQPQIEGMIASVLAGYAWDETNPFVFSAKAKLAALVQLA